jgi:ABC-2 type transport system ATP-binding protein
VHARPGLEDSVEIVLDKRDTGTTNAIHKRSVADGVITIYAKRGRKALPELLRVTNEANIEVLSVEVREPDLEAVFLQLTGRALRD